jgi:hypothetical protein
VTDNRIAQWSKSGFDVVKKAGSAKAKKLQNQSAADERGENVSYLEGLQNSCDAGFDGFSAMALGSANDAELLAIWQGMSSEHHSVGAYRAPLAEKLARFKSSGVKELGRKDAHDEMGTSVMRDTRVVWVRDFPGNGKTLYYQSQDGYADPSTVAIGDPGTEWVPDYPSGPRAFGPTNVRSDMQLGRTVPTEFLEAALSKSEQVWGATLTIDPRDHLRRNGFDPNIVDGKQQTPVAASAKNKANASDDLAQVAASNVMNSIFFGDDTQPLPNVQSSAPSFANTANVLPQGSVFDDQY